MKVLVALFPGTQKRVFAEAARRVSRYLEPPVPIEIVWGGMRRRLFGWGHVDVVVFPSGKIQPSRRPCVILNIPDDANWNQAEDLIVDALTECFRLYTIRSLELAP